MEKQITNFIIVFYLQRRDMPFFSNIYENFTHFVEYDWAKIKFSSDTVMTKIISGYLRLFEKLLCGDQKLTLPVAFEPEIVECDVYKISKPLGYEHFYFIFNYGSQFKNVFKHK